MALSDLAVFSEHLYENSTEILRQQIDLFNGASRGVITLTPGAMSGDYEERAFFQKISGLVKRRNAYGTGAQAPKKLVHILDNMVKVAAGSVPVDLSPGQFKWIQMNPEVAGAAMGQQLAVDTMADMLNTAILTGRIALGQVAAVVHDITAEATKTMNAAALNKGAFKFGDRSSDIVAWICHSTPMSDYYGAAIANTNSLFSYGTINVLTDPFGRVFIVTDAPGLIEANGGGAGVNAFHNMGLTPSAINVEQNNDFTDNFETKNGDENISRTYQSEWSYNVGVKGFAWDKTNGGKSPNDAALATAANWDKFVTDNKDLAGVIVKSL